MTNKDHSNVMRDIRSLIEAIAMDSKLNPCAISTTYEGRDGRRYPMYELDKDTCLTLLLGYDPAARMKVVKRWQELEAAQVPQVPQTLAQALRLAADQAEQIEQQQSQLAIAAPKVEFVDRYVIACTGAKGFREVAKLLQANEAEFRLFLQEQKIMYRLGDAWSAYQHHADAGRFVVKTGVAKLNEHAFTTTLFTVKGIEWIAGLWGSHKARRTQAMQGGSYAT